MRDLTSVMFLGVGKSMISLIFVGSTATPLVEITWPRYWIYFLKKSHLLNLAYSLFYLNNCNTILRCSS
jgi:hypothetical protein